VRHKCQHLNGEPRPLAVSEPPKANKEKKEMRTKARTQQTQEQGQEEEEEE
jgi:hypothetical protein